MTDLHDTVTFAIRDNLSPRLWADADDIADVVIRALDLANPCAATGCRMRQIARRHAEASSKLEIPNE